MNLVIEELEEWKESMEDDGMTDEPFYYDVCQALHILRTFGD